MTLKWKKKKKKIIERKLLCCVNRKLQPPFLSAVRLLAIADYLLHIITLVVKLHVDLCQIFSSYFSSFNICNQNTWNSRLRKLLTARQYFRSKVSTNKIFIAFPFIFKVISLIPTHVMFIQIIRLPTNFYILFVPTIKAEKRIGMYLLLWHENTWWFLIFGY